MAASEERRGSVRAMRIAGIDIYLHWSWLGIAALLIVSLQAQLVSTNPDLEPVRAWGYATLASALFLASVLLHELAHGLMARARGIEVAGITLYLFGGATEADASSRSATDELVIAIVGPITSVAIGVVLLAAGAVADVSDQALGGLLVYLGVANFILAAFNLTPGLPLDGGRVFRALVWKVTGDFRKATTWAANGGIIVGYGLIGLGILALWAGAVGGLWFAAIGWMILSSARAAGRQELLRATFAGLTAADVMSPGVKTIEARSTLDDALTGRFARADHAGFPVTDGSEVVGMLTLQHVQVALAGGGDRARPVGEMVEPLDPALIVAPDTPMEAVIDALSRSGRGGRALVVDGESLVGIISPRDVIRYETLASLPGSSPSAGGGPDPTP